MSQGMIKLFRHVSVKADKKLICHGFPREILISFQNKQFCNFAYTFMFTKQVSSIMINRRPYFPVMNDAGFELLLIVFFLLTPHYNVHVTQIGE